MKVTVQQVKDSLPSPPTSDMLKYYYSVERISPMVVKVWLHMERNWDFNLGEGCKVIYCYLKNDKVHAPKSSDKMQVKSSCHLSELSEQNPYSIFRTTQKSLQWMK